MFQKDISEWTKIQNEGQEENQPETRKHTSSNHVIRKAKAKAQLA